jgi:hypothetical protein
MAKLFFNKIILALEVKKKKVKQNENRMVLGTNNLFRLDYFDTGSEIDFAGSPYG